MLLWIVGSFMALALVISASLVLTRPQLIPAIARRLSPANVLFMMGALAVIVGLAACLCYHLRATKAVEAYSFDMELELYDMVMADRAKVHRCLFAVCAGVALMLVAGAVKLMQRPMDRAGVDDDAPADWIE